MALTATQIIEAKRLRRQNPPTGWKELGRIYGVSPTTVRMDCDLEYRARRMAQINARRNPEGRQRGRQKTSTNPTGHNGSQITRIRRKANFATFRGSTLQKTPPLPAYAVPDMDDAAIAGIDYHANEGCKYILGDRRGGPHNLPLCCGGERLKRYVNGTEITLPYCEPHALRTGAGNYGGRR